MVSFSAQVKNQAKLSEDKLLRIAKTAIQAVISDAQTPVAMGGNMPVDTANLRNTLASGLNGAFGAEGSDSYVLSIAKMEVGDAVTVRWTAAYARRRHYGLKGDDSLGRTYNETGRMWRDLAAERWQEQVNLAAQVVK